MRLHSFVWQFDPAAFFVGVMVCSEMPASHTTVRRLIDVRVLPMLGFSFFVEWVAPAEAGGSEGP